MEVPVLLRELIRRFDPAIDTRNIADVEISGVQEDSRLVKAGHLFIARSGTKTDGAKFIADAQSRGAVAVVTNRVGNGAALPTIVIDDPSAPSRLANLFHGEPSANVRVLGITGTNGKTTTTYLIRHILAKAGIRCGMIGTVEIDDGKTRREAQMTTPGAVEVAQYLAAMRDNGCKACAIETSSHALHQQRVNGVRFAAGAFTNLTRDHFDYHQTEAAYADAKAMLFEMLPADAAACVNVGSDFSQRMVQHTTGRVVGWGFANGADYRASDVAITAAGSNFVLTTPDGAAPVHMPLVGRHNIENALCATALVCETFGLSVHQIATALVDAQGAPGRLQPVRCGQRFAVLVDYAHTDDALKNVLTALRPLTRGKLLVLFGCGGDRDRTKRPLMAAAAQKLADAVYITSDNPRTENPQSIIDEIRKGLHADSGTAVVIEPDRRRAIQRALNDAVDGDVVLLAGKGHENYQIVGTTKHHFDDVEEAANVLRERADVKL